MHNLKSLKAFIVARGVYPVTDPPTKSFSFQGGFAKVCDPLFAAANRPTPILPLPADQDQIRAALSFPVLSRSLSKATGDAREARSGRKPIVVAADGNKKFGATLTNAPLKIARGENQPIFPIICHTLSQDWIIN
jgi:hypothetical protein